MKEKLLPMIIIGIMYAAGIALFVDGAFVDGHPVEPLVIFWLNIGLAVLLLSFFTISVKLLLRAKWRKSSSRR